MDEKARAASFGLIDQLRLEHPFETGKQIMNRYGERLVADPELMADAMRGFLELARRLDPGTREGCPICANDPNKRAVGPKHTEASALLHAASTTRRIVVGWA